MLFFTILDLEKQFKTYLNLSTHTSASKTTRLPSGQITWSTWERTRSHVSSGVRRLAWERKHSERFIYNISLGEEKRETKDYKYSPHQFQCWNVPCCIQCNYSSFDPNVLLSPHSYSLHWKKASKASWWFTLAILFFLACPYIFNSNLTYRTKQQVI